MRPRPLPCAGRLPADADGRYPSDLLLAAKRSPAYRRLRCHLDGPCPEDVWADGPRDAFVVFRLRPGTSATHVGFALDRRRREVTRVRLLSIGPWTVAGSEVTLAPCGDCRPAVTDREVSG